MNAGAFRQRAIQIPVLVFILSRLWVVLFVYLGHSQRAYLAPIPGGWEGVPNWWLNPWTAYDSKHFLDIALNGYNSQSAVFFPLYPFLLKLAGSNPLWMTAWGIALSNMTFLGALLVLYRLTEREYSSPVACWAVWILAFCPTAAYFSAVYTDSLFLLLFLLTFWQVRNNNWARAATYALLASLTRQVGILICIALCIEAWQAHRRGERIGFPMICAVLAPLFSLAVWQGVLAVQIDDVARGLTSQQTYFRAPMWPWIPIWKDIQLFFSFNPDPILWLHLGVTLCALLLLIEGRKKQPLSYEAMTTGIILMNFSLGHVIPPHTLPMARYMSTMFPFIQRLSVVSERVCTSHPRRFVFAFIYLIFSALYAYRFGLKDFIG